MLTASVDPFDTLSAKERQTIKWTYTVTIHQPLEITSEYCESAKTEM